MQQIIKIRTGRFLVEWTQRPQEKLTVDFLPLIKTFKLEPPFCLLHWQAKPKGLRRWGIYDGATDVYVGCDWDSIHLLCKPKVIEISENVHRTVPTAVLLFQGSLTRDGERYRIAAPDSLNGGKMLLNDVWEPDHETTETV